MAMRAAAHKWADEREERVQGTRRCWWKRGDQTGLLVFFMPQRIYFYFFIFHHHFGQRLCSVRLVLLIASALYLQCLSSLSDLSAVSVSLVSDWDSFGHCFKRNVLYVEVKVEPTGFQLLNCCTHVLKKMFSVSLCSSCLSFFLSDLTKRHSMPGVLDTFTGILRTGHVHCINQSTCLDNHLAYTL